MKTRFRFLDDSSVILEEPEDESIEEGANDGMEDTSDSSDTSLGGDTSGSDGTDSDSSAVGEPEPGMVQQDIQLRPLFDTPLDDYTVTEGLLLLLLVVVAVSAIVSLIRGK